MTNEIQKHTGGAVTATNGAFSQSMEMTGSTVGEVMAAREKAMIESRLTIAMHNRRDWDDIRVSLMKAVERPGFADADMRKQAGSAWYKLPFGDNAEGFSIRFAEEALRTMGNLDAQSTIIWDDDDKRIIQVVVFDLEANISIPTQIIVDKTVEKKKLKTNRQGHIVEVALRTRINSSGETNYIVKADESTLLRKQNAAISKALRNGIMRLVPGDIQATCRERIMQIRHGDTATDPDGARKKLIDAFSRLNVSPSDLSDYAGFDLGKLSPAQIDHLRELYDAIRAGRTTWQKVMVEVREERGELEPMPTTLEDVAKEVQAKTEEAKTVEPKNGVDPQPAIDLSRKLWTDDHMVKLSELCRKQKFSVTSMTREQNNWLMNELGLRVDAIEAEKDEEMKK